MRLNVMSSNDLLVLVSTIAIINWLNDYSRKTMTEMTIIVMMVLFGKFLIFHKFSF